MFDRWRDRLAYAGLGIVLGVIAMVIFPSTLDGAVPLSGWSVFDEAKTQVAGSTVKVLIGGGHGSGTHIGNGYIVTAAHVTDGAKGIKVKGDTGLIVDAELLWQNTAYDVALLRIKEVDRFSASPMSCRSPDVGEEVTAKGNPLALEFITTKGRIAGSVRQVGPWKTVVVVDLTIVQGNSGGGLFDKDGNLVGVNVGLMVSHVGLSPSLVPVTYAVPASTVCYLMARA